jgi:predicted dehydrogenase
MVRLALIGCGGIARMHADYLLDLRDRVRVVAAVDLDIERAKTTAEALGASLAAADYCEALEHCDAVLIALPHHEHYSVGLACLQAGKHVLMEKPLANTEEQCRDLIEAARTNALILMVAYCMRFHPLSVALKRLLDERTYGQAFYVSVWTEQHTQFPADHWASSAEKLGGGQLFSHGCHYVDLLLWMLGDPIEGVHLGTNLGTPWMEREGTSEVILRFSSGAVGHHGATWGARGTRLGYAMHAHTAEGMLEADFGRGRLTLIRDGAETCLLETEPWCKHGVGEMRHFLGCIETGGTPVTDGLSGLQGLRVIWRLYEAERQGRMADLRGLALPDHSLRLPFDAVG